jgi:hypothetical protein
MLQAIEAVQNQKRRGAGEPAIEPDARVRGWMKEFHQYSHLSRIAVRIVMDIDEDFTNYRLGPDEDEGRFRACIAHGIPVVGAHLEALDNLRRLTGRNPIQDLPVYIDRVELWQKAQPGIVDTLELRNTRT